MDDIIEPTIDYDFSKLYLAPPSSLAGGAYFTKLMQTPNKQLFIQTPKSLTKQGFVKNGKKMYADLMFDNNDTVFINWIENLESKCQDLIFSKSESWFETGLEKDDIESAFTSPFKIFKTGKYYLLRVNIKQNIKIYDENTHSVIKTEDISPDNAIVSILEIQGIKFTSRNFQIEIELRQAMVVSKDPFLDECFIQIKKPQQQQSHQSHQQQQAENFKEKKENIDKLIYDSVQELKENSSIVTELDSGIREPNSSIVTELDLEELLDTIQSEQEKEQEQEQEKEQEEEDEFKEVELTVDDGLETISLKKHNDVYYDIYKTAKEKAKDAKKNAIQAYLEMKNIKKTYMLEDESDESDEDEFYGDLET